MLPPSTDTIGSSTVAERGLDTLSIFILAAIRILLQTTHRSILMFDLLWTAGKGSR